VQAAAQAVGLALGPTLGGILVSSIGWRWVFWVNVPVGVIALALGWELLPRTRQMAPAVGLDRTGVVLVAGATTALLLFLSAVSGLSLPLAATIALAAAAVLAAGGSVRHQRRALHPLIDRTLLGDRVVWTGLLGALGGYLVLFGPLVLVPVVLTSAHPPSGGRPLGTLAAGLVLTSLPVGFAAAATLGGRLLPATWTDRRRGTLGVTIAGLALAALLVAPLDPAWLVPLLAVLGLGLGVFTPSNNAQVMGAIPAASSGTAGGMLNMTRSLGTALGVCGITLSLHLGAARTGVALLLVVAGLTLVSVLAAGTPPFHPRRSGPP
jgi:MFS family permease